MSCSVCLWLPLFCLLLGVLATNAWSEQVSVAGSTTVKPIMDKATQEYQKSHSDVKFVVGAGGTGQGVKLAGTGEVMIGMASRALKDKEKSQYPELVSTKIGLDGIVVRC